MRSVVLVAGYATPVEVPGEYEDLTRALLRAARRRGRALGLKVRYRVGLRSSAVDPFWILMGGVVGRGVS